VSKEQLKLSDALFEIKVAEAQAAILGGSKGNRPVDSATKPEFGQGCSHRRSLQLVQVFTSMGHDGETISEFGYEAGEIPDPCLVARKAAGEETSSVGHDFLPLDAKSRRGLEVGAQVNAESPVGCMMSVVVDRMIRSCGSDR
jgi:hypothetical protein